MYLLFYDLIKTNNEQENSTNNQPDTNRVQRRGHSTEKSFLGIEILMILLGEQPDHKNITPVMTRHTEESMQDGLVPRFDLLKQYLLHKSLSPEP